MCVQDIEQVSQEMEDLGDGSTNKKPWPLLSRGDFLSTQMENWVHKDSPFPLAVVAGSNRLESISEETVATDKKHDLLTNFIPTLRSGEWSDIGGRPYMEDTHVCIADLAKDFGRNLMSEDTVSFYGMFIKCLNLLLPTKGLKVTAMNLVSNEALASLAKAEALGPVVPMPESHHVKFMIQFL